MNGKLQTDLTLGYFPVSAKNLTDLKMTASTMASSECRVLKLLIPQDDTVWIKYRLKSGAWSRWIIDRRRIRI